MRHRSVKPVSIKLLLALFAAGFGIFFAVDVATRGIERIHGPVDAALPAAQAGAKAPQTASAPPAGQSGTKKPDATAANAAQGQEQVNAAPKQQAIIEESAVNRVSSGIGEVLRRTANVCLKVIVSVFEAIFG